MAAINWNSGVSGDWDNAADWSNGAVPGAGDDVTVAVAGAFTVTISTADAAHSLTLDNATATIADTGSLTLGTTLAVTAGTFELEGGTISRGTLSAMGGSFVWNTGTLDGTTFDGTLDMSTAHSMLTVSTNGITLKGAGGTGPGTIDDTGAYAHLLIYGSQTLDNAIVDLGNASGFATLYEEGGGTLTLGSGLTIDHSARRARITQTRGGNVINNGAIDAGYSGGSLYIEPASFTNAGHITVSNGDSVFIEGAVFANAGSIAATGGGYVDIDTTTFTNSGSITAGSGGRVSFNTAFTTASLEDVTNSGGTIRIGGVLTNTGSTLVVGSGASLGALVLTGTISGGTIADAGSGIIASGGTLDGTTYDGTLDMSAAHAALTVSANGITLKGVGGAGPGSIDDTGAYSRLYFDGSQTLAGATVNLGNASSYASLYEKGDGTLTLGSGVTVNHVARRARISNASGGNLLNDGTIKAGYSGGTLIIEPTSFTNAGSLTVSNGDQVLMEPTTFINSGSIAVTSGGNLSLKTHLATASLKGVTDSGGTIAIEGVLYNAGATLSIGAGTGLGSLTLPLYGTISGGVIADAGSGIVANGGTLDGVTYEGAVDLSETRAALTVSANGITLKGAGGAGAGTVNDTGDYSRLVFNGSQTVDDATVNLGNASGFARLYEVGGGTLTLGVGLTVDHHADRAMILSGNAGTVINQGTIMAGYSGGHFYVEPTRFTNAGVIDASNGDHMFLKPATFTNSGLIDASSGGTADIYPTGTFTNLSGTTLTGGSLEAQAASTINLAQNTTIVTDVATIILSGAGSKLQSLNNANQEVALDATLATIASGGTLELLAARAWTTSLVMTNAGNLQLGGGAFTAPSLVNTGTVSGYGDIVATVTSSGTLVAQGGSLSLVATTLTNLSGTTLKSGTLGARGSTATLELADNASITTLSGRVFLSSAGSELQGFNTAASRQVTIEESLTTITSSGALRVLAGRAWRSTGALSDAGTIQLGGGQFSSGALSTQSGGTLSGFGTFASVVTDAGGVSAAGGALAFTATGDAFSGAIGGTEVDFSGGTDLLQSGSSLTASKFGLSGDAVVSVDVSLTCAGTFADGATLDIAKGVTLALAGASSFTGSALVNGAGVLSLAQATIAGLAIGGTVALDDTGAVLQTGAMTLGDAAGAVASLQIATGATWNIEGDVGIGLGKAKTSAITVVGTLIKTAGMGVATIAPKLSDGGLIEDMVGTLDLAGAVTGAGMLKIDAGASLELAAGAAKTLTVEFNGAGAALNLSLPAKMAAVIAGFTAGESIDLLKTAATGASLNGSDQLLVVDGNKTVATLQLSGNYAGQTFAVGSDGHKGSVITVSGGGRINQPPALFVQAMAGMALHAGGAEIYESGSPRAWRTGALSVPCPIR